MRELLAIAMGGAVGAVSRHLAAVGVRRAFGDGFPWGILTVNVVGCFLIGMAVEFSVARRDVPAHLHAGFAIGFLGALTTFSTFGHDTFRLLEAGRTLAALGNVGANLAVGLAAVWLGVAVGKVAFPSSLSG